MPSMMIGVGVLMSKQYNWRVINNNMIQTTAKEVFLWDNNEGVAVRVPVPSRPWKKLDASFAAWMNADGWEGGLYPSAPVNVLDKTKIAYDDGTVTHIDEGGISFTTFDPPF